MNVSKPGRGRWIVMLSSLAGLVGCDHVTKFAAKAALEDEAPRAVLGPFLDLRYVENTDIGFNLLRAVPERVRTPLLLVLGTVMIAILAIAFVRAMLQPALPRLMAPGLMLLLAGALGNVSDRMVRGYVVDFLHIPHWPVFNVADIVVVIGAGLLLLTARKTAATVPL